MSVRDQLLALTAIGALLAIGSAMLVLDIRPLTPSTEAQAAGPRSEHEALVPDARTLAREEPAELTPVALEAPEPPEEPASAREDVEPTAVAERGGPPALEAAVEWLRKSLPERYGELSIPDAALLADLDLRGAAITDEDLRQLAALPALSSLCLHGTAITDAGVVVLRELRELRSLDLRETQVSGDCLSSLPSLEALHLTQTRVTGSDLIRLPPMPRLEKLKLNSLAAVDDAALVFLASYQSLRHLELDRTGITDEGLRRLLVQNPGLTRIELRGTAVTQESRAELAAAYPACELVLDDPADPRLRGRDQ